MAVIPKAGGVKASPLPRRGSDIGDGDPCPMGHGRMIASPKTQTQYCVHREHEGFPKTHPTRPGLPPSRSRWPLGHASFEAAVAEWRKLDEPQGEAAELPDLDIDLGGPA